MEEKEDIKMKNAIELGFERWFISPSWFVYESFIVDLTNCGDTKEEILKCALSQIAEKANQYKSKLDEINKISEAV